MRSSHPKSSTAARSRSSTKPSRSSIGMSTLPIRPTRQAFESLVAEETRAIFIESVSNPDGVIADIEGIADVAKRAGVPLICRQHHAFAFSLQSAEARC